MGNSDEKKQKEAQEKKELFLAIEPSTQTFDSKAKIGAIINEHEELYNKEQKRNSN